MQLLSYAHERCSGLQLHRVVRSIGPASATVLTRLVDDYTRIGSPSVFCMILEAVHLRPEVPQDFDIDALHELGRVAQGLEKVEIVVVETEPGREETEFRKTLYMEMKGLREKTLGMEMEVDKCFMRFSGCTWTIVFTKKQR